MLYPDELDPSSFKTRAAESATEVKRFLQGGPTLGEVLGFAISERGQTRMQRLPALNREGLLGADEVAELDELQNLEHIVIKLKAGAASRRD